MEFIYDPAQQVKDQPHALIDINVHEPAQKERE